MIRLPRRSVTRFFIPLIDVLTLLFCTFLLLPMLNTTPSAATGIQAATAEEEVQRLKRELEQRQRETPEAVRKELEELKQQKVKALQDRLAIRVLEIDDAGRLRYRDAVHPEGVPITSERDARNLVDADALHVGGSRRELYYLILYPQDPNSPYPTRGQYEKYERWFKEVAHGYDLSRAEIAQGGKP
jgi:hypothetical protein